VSLDSKSLRTGAPPVNHKIAIVGVPDALHSKNSTSSRLKYSNLTYQCLTVVEKLTADADRRYRVAIHRPFLQNALIFPRSLLAEWPEECADGEEEGLED